MAHKKGGGATKTNRDSNSKRLGVKRFGGELVSPGHIIVRQKGRKVYPGVGVKQGNDYTIFAKRSGKIEFKKKFNKTIVNVI